MIRFGWLRSRYIVLELGGAMVAERRDQRAQPNWRSYTSVTLNGIQYPTEIANQVRNDKIHGLNLPRLNGKNNSKHTYPITFSISLSQIYNHIFLAFNITLMTLFPFSNLRVVAFNTLLIIILAGCFNDQSTSDPKPEPLKEVQEAYDIMKLPYLWSEQVDQNLDLTNYRSPIDLVTDLKAAADRFTFIEEGNDIAKELQGTPVSTGLQFKYLNDTLYIAYVDLNSPADLAGLKRSYAVLSINDKTLTPQPSTVPSIDLTQTITLKYLDSDGKTHTKAITPTEYDSKVVIHQEVKTLKINSKKIGYLVYTAFTSNSDEQLTAAFTNFKTQDIDELVLDLRYNGGGSVLVARQLASLIKRTLKDRIFAQYTYNKPFTEYLKENEPDAINNNKLAFTAPAEGLNLFRLFVLTSSRTASASELIINSLRPFMEVILIGDKTVGKNVASLLYTLEGTIKSYSFLPIIILITNANNESDYGAGFEPNFKSFDDVSEPFGSPNDPMLAQAIYYIENGSFSPVSRLNRRLERNQPTLGDHRIDNMILLEE